MWPRGLRNLRISRRSAAGAFVGCVLVGPATPATASAVLVPTGCRQVAVPVRIGSAPGAVAGTLCVPPGATTVQLLVPGNTYNRSYWQAEVDPDTYNWVRRANRAGYATLAVDRIGTGASTHPAAGGMTLGRDVATIHEVVTALRARWFGPFDRVVGIGHSLGSAVLNQDAGAHPGDFDALVLTGFSHAINFANASFRVASRYELPAGDPAFAGRQLDDTYVAAPPGGRTAFYAPTAVDAAVLAWDDGHRDTGNTVELSELGRFQVPNLSRAISGPVLIVDGTQDAVACGLGADDCTGSEHLLAAERPWFATTAHLTAWAVPGAGHDVTMHRAAAAVGGRILCWVDHTVGPGSAGRNSVPGRIPGDPRPPDGVVDPGARSLDAAFAAGTPAVADGWATATGPVPGLGDSRNPAPVYDDALRTVADLPAARGLPMP